MSVSSPRRRGPIRRAVSGYCGVWVPALASLGRDDEKLLLCPAGLVEEAGELLLEARHAAAAVHELLLAAGPSRVRFRVDVEMHDIAFLAPGGAGGELGAVGHHHLDGVIVGMNLGFHELFPCGARERAI